MLSTEAIIIGAGPYGLSISAHLRDRGVEHVIVGRQADTWRSHMPEGMCLKSEPYASSMSSPSTGTELADYCASAGVDYVHRGTAQTGPLTLSLFLAYADWYAGRLVTGVRDVRVTEVVPASGGFRLTFDGLEPLFARQVVLATGVLPYAYLPPELAGLPSALVTHSSEHADLSPLCGSRVVVVGAGQSALETAALLHETGAEVRLVARRQALSWVDPNPDDLGPLGHLRRPVTRLCEGWRCAFWNSPAAFRRLPEQLRLTKARTVLGPSGSWWLRDRVEGKIEVLAGRQVIEATPSGAGVRLRLAARAGGSRPSDETILDADHVIAGTGFRTDLSRLAFLPGGLRSQIVTSGGYPVVSRRGESSVPGLFFAGAHTAASLGPSARFIGGTHRISGLIAATIAKRSRLTAADRDAEQALVV